MNDARTSTRLLGGILVLSFLGCGSWRADADGFTERDLTLLSEMVVNGRPPPHPGDAVATDQRVAEFGQQLFFDKALSPGRPDGTRSSTTVACSDCHNPNEWFSDSRPENNVSQGVGLTTRNSPSLVNVAFYETFGWDGRADTLWGQCDHAYQSPRTMKGTQLQLLLAVRERYAARYALVFPGEPLPLPQADAGADALDPFYRNILKAWAAYLTQLSSADSPFDRFAQGDREALTVEQRRGLLLFLGKAGCIECHEGPTLTDNDYHAVGIGQSGRGVPDSDPGRETGLAALRGLRFRPDGAMTPPEPTAADRGRFRTKGLRQVARTAPYFHGGQAATLKDVVWFYNQGGDHEGGGEVSPFMVPLGLTELEQAELVSFLEALTGAEVPAALRCDNSRPLTVPDDVTSAAIAPADSICGFGGVLLTRDGGFAATADGGLEALDGGSTRVCNGAPALRRCEVIP